VDYKLKKNINVFVENSCTELESTKNQEIKSSDKKNAGNISILERLENNMLKWYGNVENNGWPMQIHFKRKTPRTTRSDVGRKCRRL
jgi:hypothetical protein